MRRLRGDDGFGALEVVIGFPALLVLILVSVHVGIRYHAHTVAMAAAEDGARAARILGGTGNAGDVEARNALAQLGPTAVRSPQVTVVRDDVAGTVTAIVSGTSQVIVPFLPTVVEATVVSPIEVFQS